MGIVIENVMYKYTFFPEKERDWGEGGRDWGRERWKRERGKGGAKRE